MSQHWKPSMTRYYCNYCQVFVRDTKLERTNHEATAKHQGAIKRHLRNLHRDHEVAEREKDRARREIDRLAGAKTESPSSSAAPAASSRAPQHAPPARAATEAERRAQMEQLASMGVALPEDVRTGLAMPGEWTVTAERAVKSEEEKRAEMEEGPVERRAMGVRKRGPTEEERDEEDAVKALFKKPKKWGRDTKRIPGGEDKELEALLSQPLAKKLKKEEDAPSGAGDAELKAEEDAPPQGTDAKAGDESIATATVKNEQEEDSNPLDALIPKEEDAPHTGDAEDTGAVVFKKRKAKHIRQK